MTVVRNLGLTAVILMLSVGSADAAIVSFTGFLGGPSGLPGPIFGSFPRNFTLVLDFTEGNSGSTPATGFFEFPTTPNVVVPGTSPEPGFTLPTTATVDVRNDVDAGGTLFDVLNVTGDAGSGLFSYGFLFDRDGDRIDTDAVDLRNIQRLIAGGVTATINGAGPTTLFAGQIRATPEPATMLAMTGMVVAACCVGVGRRLVRRQETPESENG